MSEQQRWEQEQSKDKAVGIVVVLVIMSLMSLAPYGARSRSSATPSLGDAHYCYWIEGINNDGCLSCGVGSNTALEDQE